MLFTEGKTEWFRRYGAVVIQEFEKKFSLRFMKIFRANEINVIVAFLKNHFER